MPSATAYHTEISKIYLPAIGPPRPLEKGWVSDSLFSMLLLKVIEEGWGTRGVIQGGVCSLAPSPAVLSSASSERMLDYYSKTSEDCHLLFPPSLSPSHNMVLYTSPLSFACPGV